MLEILLKQLENQYQSGQYHYSLSVPMTNHKKMPFDYFKQLNDKQRQEAFFFETPTQDFSMVGTGYLEIVTGGINTLNDWKKNKTIRYKGDKKSGVGPFVFGSFPFFDNEENSDLWGDFTKGCHVLPRLVVTWVDKTCYLTINIFGESLDVLKQEVMKNWQTFDELARRDSCNKKAESTVILQEEIDVENWLDTVDLAVDTLKTSPDMQKIVLARKMVIEKSADIIPSQVIEALKEQQRNTFFFSFSLGDKTFTGATPERLLKASPTEFVTASIAGSIPRGKTKAEDDTLAYELLGDTKNRHEHEIVLSRIKEDLHALTGNKACTSDVSILKNKDIQHLHVPLSVERSESVSFLSGVAKLHPTPALGGEPKELSSSWLKQHEPLVRGLYGAPIGWSSLIWDTGEYVVGIRSALLEKNRGTLFAGCGIVEDSKKELEQVETLVKFKPMLRGLGGSVL